MLTYFGENFDSGTYDQIKTAMGLPVAVKGALMPDAHQGYALPIGGVIALRNAISPSMVGYDIACRMSCTFFNIDPEQMEVEKQNILQKILASTSFGIGSEGSKPEHPIMDDRRWGSSKILSELKDLAWSQLGSSGSGNHFAAFMSVKMGDDECGALVTHSGSRGTGYKVASHFCEVAQNQVDGQGIHRDYAWLDTETEEGQQYITAMQLMGDYAKANHRIIHRKFSNLFEYEEGSHFENHHNFAWLEEIDGEKLWVHRKGATPAHEDEFGVIPGSMATTSYIVKGKGNPDSLFSASHGAGRVSSRRQAKKNFDEELYEAVIEDLGIVTHGIARDESFMAYKDIEAVMDAQKDCVNVVATMQPRVEVMAG